MNEKALAARKQLGGFIKNRREQMGRTQQELADFVGVTANTIQGVETGRFAMDIDLQFAIYAALEIKPYFSVENAPDDEDYTLRQKDDPERYHGFYLCDNILIHPGQLAIVKLTHPRLFVSFNYGNSFFSSYEDWKSNHTDLQWLDPNDRPTDDGEIDNHLIDCWNFLAMSERKEDEEYG